MSLKLPQGVDREDTTVSYIITFLIATLIAITICYLFYYYGKHAKRANVCEMQLDSCRRENRECQSDKR